LGIPWCAYTAPNDTLNDIQTSGEYLVYAIRTEYALAGRPIAVMGHSQGGMSMRWPLRFWPDTRAMVADVIGFSGSNHGTTAIGASCATVGCPAADWQQAYQSPFIQALNSEAETFPGIAYTEIWTHTDEVVDPNGSAAVASAALHTGGGAITDVATQQLCPADVYEHLTVGTIDPVTYALAVDALTHPGPANLARVKAEEPNLCSQLYMPGVNPANVNMYLQILSAAPGLLSVVLGPLATAVSGAPVLRSAPPLECYVDAACTGAAAPQLLLRFLDRPRHPRAGRITRVQVQVRAREGDALLPVSGVRVSFGGRALYTGPQGTAAFAVRLGRAGRYRLSARRPGCDPTGGSITVQRR
ncbi:MAG TPA: hypothetical protein VG223_17725, partial [Solirubrobacteraceae bacterium]|nr:hypothetical protein [Solirubrobacteraceae bacterium]